MAMNSQSSKTLTVTLVRSTVGRTVGHKACVKGLGLRRIGHVVQVEDSPSVRGMINKIDFMLKVEGA